jgi:glycosyltransferase involved in cell wall biosynthesis
MKIAVTIPALNEEATIARVIEEIPKDIGDVRVIVVDDGSTDQTAEVARKAGAKVITFKENRGLAMAFKEGMDVAIEEGADVIVNIDADFQYDPKEIPKLIQPILDGEADIVLGSRFRGWIEEMPLSKRVGNKIATIITSWVSGCKISDAQTGFRAFSREAALQLNVLSDYTYVQETIIQAVQKKLRIAEVPCTFRKREGKSRLIPSIFSYAKRAGLTILRTYLYYKPLRTFSYIGGIIFIAGLLVGVRVLLHFLLTGHVSPYYPSAILTAVLMIIGFQIIMLGLLADVMDRNRRLQEEILYRLKR